MTYRPLKGPLSADESAGLAQFFKGQADQMLSQYENINQLLGPTTDWSHPGTHCEVLLRDFLRRYVLGGVSVDKGYVFGGVTRAGVRRHCPEVDILIHDEHRYRPLFRMGELVVVHPDSVMGVIQVKRTFRSGEGGPIDKGIAQVVDVKQHLLDVRVSQKTEDEKKTVEWRDLKPVFGAVVAFEDETQGELSKFREPLLKHYLRNGERSYKAPEFDTGVWVLPHFVGSLKGTCLTSAGTNVAERMYWAMTPKEKEDSVALQVLLAGLMDLFWPEQDWMPLGFPPMKERGNFIQVPRPDESLHDGFKYKGPPLTGPDSER